MPKVYLSPAYHRQNECCYHRPDGKQCYETLENNEYFDELEVFLKACGIEYRRGPRRTPMSNEDGTQLMYQAVRESNAYGADVHYVSHTNASSNGSVMGCHPMYYPTSKNGKRLGEIMVKYRKEVYPYAVKLIARSNLYELRVPNAVSFYEEHAFHDNLTDITWFHEHMRDVARSAAKGLCEYFGISFVDPYAHSEPQPPSNASETGVSVSVRQLAAGMRGSDVKALQLLLNGIGYSCGAADGIFGTGTENALKRMQSAHGLSADGVAGKATWSALLAK